MSYVDEICQHRWTLMVSVARGNGPSKAAQKGETGGLVLGLVPGAGRGNGDLSCPVRV